MLFWLYVSISRDLSFFHGTFVHVVLSLFPYVSLSFSLCLPLLPCVPLALFEAVIWSWQNQGWVSNIGGSIAMASPTRRTTPTSPELPLISSSIFSTATSISETTFILPPTAIWFYALRHLLIFTLLCLIYVLLFPPVSQRGGVVW